MTKCVEGGARYVLVAEGNVYQLDPRGEFKGYAGQSVTVTGTLRGDTINLESVEPEE